MKRGSYKNHCIIIIFFTSYIIPLFPLEIILSEKLKDFYLNNQPAALIIPNLFCHKTLHVSGIFFAHHQGFSIVHSTLVSFMSVSDDRFQAESGWN
jgi:hypothetical protein